MTQQNRIEEDMCAKIRKGNLVGFYARDEDGLEYKVGVCEEIHDGFARFSLVARDGSPMGEWSGRVGKLPAVCFCDPYIRQIETIIGVYRTSGIPLTSPKTVAGISRKSISSELVMAQRENQVVTLSLNGSTMEFFGMVRQTSRHLVILECYDPVSMTSEGFACLRKSAVSELWLYGYRHGVAKVLLESQGNLKTADISGKDIDSMVEEAQRTGFFIEIFTKGSGRHVVRVCHVSRDSINCLEYFGIFQEPSFLAICQKDITGVCAGTAECLMMNDLLLDKRVGFQEQDRDPECDFLPLCSYEPNVKSLFVSVGLSDSGKDITKFTGILKGEDGRRLILQEVDSYGSPGPLTYINKRQIMGREKNTHDVARCEFLHNRRKRK